MLSITAPVQFGQMHVAPIVGRYLDQYPDMRARLMLFDRIVNIVEEGIDLAVRIGHLADSSLSAIRIGQVRQVVCGAPAYFDRVGVPEIPADLAGHRIIATTGSSARLDWQFNTLSGAGRKIQVSPDARWQTNSIEAARKAVIDGWGSCACCPIRPHHSFPMAACKPCLMIMPPTRCRFIWSIPKAATPRQRSEVL